MKLTNSKIFIFIALYRQYKKITSFKTDILLPILEQDLENIHYYFKYLFSWEKWKDDLHIACILFIFYFFLIVFQLLFKFLLYKFIFYSLKYILKYLFLFVDYFFYYISKKYLYVFLKKFLGFFYIIFIKLLYKIYTIIFIKLPDFYRIYFWIDFLFFLQSIWLYICHRILDVIQLLINILIFIKNLPNTKFGKFLKYLYYYNWRDLFNKKYLLIKTEIDNIKEKLSQLYVEFRKKSIIYFKIYYRLFPKFIRLKKSLYMDTFNKYINIFIIYFKHIFIFKYKLIFNFNKYMYICLFKINYNTIFNYIKQKIVIIVIYNKLIIYSKFIYIIYNFILQNIKNLIKNIYEWW